MADLVKVTIMGSGAVGKSALTLRFVQGLFVKSYDPTIEDSYRKSISLGEDQHHMMEVLDTAGVDQFHQMIDLYINNGQGFYIVYSLIERSTFYDAQELAEKIYRVKNDFDDIPMVIVGNKSDLGYQRVVTTEEGKEFASKFGARFYETSAQDMINVEVSFLDVARQVVDWKERHLKHKK
eukprot:TRINITY_DN9806_c0_g1_i1.p1 TRINITY_DN9806_c0_g1~~TRINITY_DN9806_c0_g1_i1.p1  ORF type:complete len:180 (+),score=37.30 TRINITY_DN9806_c0_g1_i1:26-565(+)